MTRSGHSQPTTLGPQPTTLGQAMQTDGARRVAVTAGAAICAVGLALVGSSVSDSGGGYFTSSSTLLAPSGPAFAIWGLIYALLAVYVVWQWLPMARTSARARITGWPAAWSLALNGCWLLVTGADWLWVSVVVILALWAVLVWLLVRVSRAGHAGVIVRQLNQLPFGIYLGWTTVAAGANVAAALASTGWSPPLMGAQSWGVAAVIAVLVVGMALVRFLPSRVPLSMAMAWGLAWIAHARLVGEPRSIPVAVAAAVSSVLVIVAAITVLSWIRSRRFG